MKRIAPNPLRKKKIKIERKKERRKVIGSFAQRQRQVSERG